MAWLDTAGLMRQIRSVPTYRPSFGGQTQSYGRTYAGSTRQRTSSLRWSDLRDGRLATRAPASDKNPWQAGQQEQGLDRFQASLPYSSSGPRSPYGPPPATTPQSTEGDWLGSIQGALGSTFGNLNLANAIPWFMERINVASHDLADKGVLGAAPLAAGTDAFIGAVDAASQAIGPVLETFPAFVRDSQLADRAKLYRSIANGEAPDFGPFGWSVSNPLAGIGELGGFLTNPTMAAQNKVFEGKSYNPLEPLFGRTVTDQSSEANHWKDAILHAADPNKRLYAEQRMSILRDSIDLPESIKLQLERNPRADDEQIKQWFDEAPEGRQWSYAEGVQGLASNLGNTLLFYAAEARAGGAVLGQVGTFGRAAQLPGAGTGIVPAAGRAAGQAIGVAAKAGSVTLKLQTAAVAAGMGYTAVSTMMNSYARYVGDEEAVAWFDNANRTTEFSDDPMVQIVTGFAVNPFKAVNQATVGGAGKGTGWVLKHGIIAPLDAFTHRKLVAFNSSTDQMEDMIGRMFKLGSRDEASRFLDEQGLRDQAHDMVVGTALDEVLDRLPKDVRTSINTRYADPAERGAYVLSRYGRQAMDLIEKDPRAVAARFHDYDWNYRMMHGEFNAEAAAKIALDYRRAMNRTYDIRAKMGATIGYREYLPPQGQVLVKAALDQATDANGNIRVRDFQMIQVDFPALRKHWGGILTEGGKLDDLIPRAKADAILDSATADYVITAKQNPVRAATGADPVLRPDSPTKMRDHAEALGTNIETVQAWSDGPAAAKDAGKTELLRAYLVEHADMDTAQAAKLTPEEVYQQAFTHINGRIEPWEAMGERVVMAERLVTDLEAELVRVKRIGGRTEHDQTVRIQAQINELRNLVRTAGDPIRTFASQAGGRSFRAMRAKMTAAIAALERGERVVDPRMETPAVEGVPSPTIGPDQLQALRNSLAEFDPADAGHNAHLAEMAARKVDALDRLRVLTSLDDELKPVGLTQTDLGLVVRGADGELAWATEITAPPEALMDTFVGFKTSGPFNTVYVTRGHYAKERIPVASTRAQGWLDLQEKGTPAQQWAAIANSPGFIRRLREQGDEVLAAKTVGHVEHPGMTGNEMADLIEAAALPRGVTGQGIDEIATAMGVTREEALQRLSEMRTARDTALDGKGPAAIKRTAAIKVPEDYQLQAEADQAARALVYDAEYEAFWHPRNVAKVQEITGSPDELWPGLRSVVEGDPILEEGIAKVAARTGKTTDEVFADASHADAVKAELVPADFEAPIEGMIREFTDLDFLIRANDQDAIAALSEQFATARAEPRPARPMSQRAAERLAKMPKNKRSYTYRRDYSDAGADFSNPLSPKLMADPKNALGLDVLSVMNHGVGGTKPATVQGLIALLKDIEDGNAGRMGLGPDMQAEGQRVARLLLDDAITTAKTNPELIGVGQAHGILVEDQQALADSLDHLMMFDDADPLGTLQYTVKKYPGDAVVMEWSRIPGLAEELFSKKFKPYEARLGSTNIRKAWNWVFGPQSNQAIRLESKNRWVERLSAQGVTPKTSEAIWNRLQEEANVSRSHRLRRGPSRAITMVSGDNPMYAGIHNIPDEKINTLLHGSDGKSGFLAELAHGADDRLSSAEYAAAKNVNYAETFRESTSFIRRTLKDKVPLGDAMAGMYGAVAHNKMATTAYYWFRFGLDVRFHAMNFFEPLLLGLGRAGMRGRKIDEGMFGMSESYLRNLDSNPMSNTGYPFSRSRFEQAYQVFLKEQPDFLRRGLQTEDPAVIEAALKHIAQHDSQLQDMIRNLDGTADPDAFLKAGNEWHAKMLRNIDEAGDAKTIDEAFVEPLKESPELAQVYDRLGQLNKDLWSDVRETFYGNPSRSRAERVLNSYLLFWPLSYQIKSTKWFLKVLFDRAGGVQTNALGAVVVDRVADTHNRLMQTDPEYRDWMEKHETLVFVAQMMFPVSFDSTGVTLNPILRGLFFDRDILKAGEIGPIYTYNKVLRPIRDELSVDLYPSVKDIPVLSEIFKPSTGKPKEPPKEAP